MATFIWPPEVQWPPPAHILLNYDVVSPDGAMLSPMRATEEEAKRMTKVVIVGELYTSPSEGPPPPGIWPGPKPEHPIYGQGGGGQQPPGMWPGGPVDPGYGVGGPGGGPGHYPSHPIAGSPPGMWPGGPVDPGYGVGGPGGQPGGPPGMWPGPHPGQGLPGQGQPQPPLVGIWPGPQPGHPIVQPPGQPLPPELAPPELPPELEDEAVVLVHLPGQEWTMTTFPVEPDQGPVPHPDQGLPGEGQPQPTPQRQRR